MKNTIINKSQLYKSDHSWLTSYHIFSFADYYDSNNIDFWNLRVFNDDFIKSETWFWLHPHRDTEILTIVLEWEITHGDSLWNKQTTKTWEIQTITAGTWILHSEQNLWKKDVHLYQIWFKTNSFSLKPEYKSHKINLKESSLNLLASLKKENNVWFLNSDVSVYRWKFDKDDNFEFEIKKSKGLFLYVYKWQIEIDWNKLQTQDHLRYSIEGVYKFKILEKSDFILIEVSL